MMIKMKKNILFSFFNVQRCQILYSASSFIWGHKEGPLWAVALFPILNSAGLNLTTKHRHDFLHSQFYLLNFCNSFCLIRKLKSVYPLVVL